MHTLPTISSLLHRAERVGLTAIDVAARSGGKVSAHRLSRLKRTNSSPKADTLQAVVSVVTAAEIERLVELAGRYPGEARALFDGDGDAPGRAA